MRFMSTLGFEATTFLALGFMVFVGAVVINPAFNSAATITPIEKVASQ